MKIRNKMKYFILGLAITLITVPCMADIKGTTILSGGGVSEKVTINVYEHTTDISSRFTQTYTFNGSNFVVPTKENTNYRFVMKAEKGGIEYYTMVANIPYNTERAFELKKVYPMEVKVQDSAGNFVDTYVKASWDNGYRVFSNLTERSNHTVYMTEFKPGVHTFNVEGEGYVRKNVKVNVSKYRTPVKVTLEPIQKGYTLKGKIRYEDGTPVKNNHFFDQGKKLKAPAYKGKLYFSPVLGETNNATILPVWGKDGSITIPNLLPGNYFTDVIFENEGKAYHILNEVNIVGDTVQDFVAKSTNALKVIGKDKMGNLLDQGKVVVQQIVIGEDGAESYQGQATVTNTGEAALFADLVEGDCTIKMIYPGHKEVEQTIKIIPGMNVVEIVLE